MFWSFFGRGQRARRGDVRAAILALLAEKPFNGYQIIQELEQRSQGAWRPSPGSVYPTFQQLEDEGLVATESTGSGRVYRLTELGERYVKEHEDEVREPWAAVARGGTTESHEQVHQVIDELRQIWAAAAQVARAGNVTQVAQAAKLLNETRRALYRILAEDDGD
jgi:DNA-binding PadR family transcriptional regulator